MHRRMGGGGGGPRGPNRPGSFSQQPFQGGVNPWQGGGGGGGSNQGGIISQLTSNPSLALALTSLLQPQQQQPPSLLSLNTSPAFSGNRGGNYGDRFGRGREVRRHEPYNKNRGNFDRRRRPSPKRNNKDNKKFEKKTDDDEEEKKDTKRDWKDEKKETEGGEEDKKEGDSKDGKYGGVPRKYLTCFVCTKQMWDGESMGKHVRGRAHQEMLKALEESIHICVNILRENLRLAEERKLIEYNRQNRQRKFGQRREPQLSHCAMCDLKFMGKIVGHRRTEGHQRLKKYLHPNCRMCDKEYPSRIEWVEHCLTPEHLKKVSQASENRAGGRDGDIITEPANPENEADPEADLEEKHDLDLDPLLEESLQMEGEDPILECDTTLENMVNRLPAYKKDRPIATQSLKEFTGFMCELCHRSFSQKEDAEAHLKTRKHFHQFVEFIKEKFDREEKKKKAEREAEKQKKEEEAAAASKTEENGIKAEGEEADQEMYDPTEATEEDKQNGEAEVKAEEPEEQVEEQMETNPEEEEEEEEEPEPEPEVIKETPGPKTRKSLAGPKSKRGRK